MKRTAIIALAIALISPLWAQVEQPPAENGVKAKILTRSFFFPGWGQLCEKQYVKGIGFAAAELFFLVQAFIANHKGDDYYWQYRFATSLEEVVSFRQLTEKYDYRRNAYLLAGSVVWIVNMIDIYLHAKKKYPKKSTLAIIPTINHEKCQVALNFSLSF